MRALLVTAAALCGCSRVGAPSRPVADVSAPSSGSVRCWYDHGHARAVEEPCGGSRRLREAASGFDAGIELSAEGAEAHGLLAGDETETAMHYFLSWQSEDGGPVGPVDAIRAIGTLWREADAARAFSALFVDARPVSRRQLAALIGLRGADPGLFSAAAEHFEHTGHHFRAMDPESTCGAGWLVSGADELGRSIDALRVRDSVRRLEQRDGRR